MAKWEASTNENEVIYMANICMIISEYADDNNIRAGHLADELLEYVLNIDEIELPDRKHIELSSADKEDDFIKKIAVSVAAYAYLNNKAFDWLTKGIWYALTEAEKDDLFNV